jgi:deoxyribodipyrimidine photo-lyase
MVTGGSLAARLRKRGSRLVMRQGNRLSTLRSLIQDTGAQAVFWNHRYEPSIVERDTAITHTLRAGGLHVESFHGGLLFEPRAVLNVPIRR